MSLLLKLFSFLFFFGAQYILLAGINDNIEDQIALGTMLQGRKNIVLNFIPYNPTLAGSSQPVQYEAPSEESVVEFQM